MNGKLWTVPATRIKGGKEHRVPLSAPALAILGKLRAIGEKMPTASEYVFNGARWEKPLSSMAMLMLLERIKRDDLTAHGFRSTFRDWAAERTNYPREAAEMALAHVVGDNRIDPQSYLADILTRLVADQRRAGLEELLPWRWTPAQETQRAA